MPFPNFHACRVKEPEDFIQDSIRTIHQVDGDTGKPLQIMIGRLKGSRTTTDQSFRYPKKEWTEAQARARCEAKGGSFEAATDNA